MAIKRRAAKTADDTTTAPAPAPAVQQPAGTGAAAAQPKAVTPVVMLPLGAYTSARRTPAAGDKLYADVVPATRTDWPTLPVA